MAHATCFRCDWAGEADGDACPNCGAPLYRQSPAAPAPAPVPAASPATLPAITTTLVVRSLRDNPECDRV